VPDRHDLAGVEHRRNQGEEVTAIEIGQASAGRGEKEHSRHRDEEPYDQPARRLVPQDERAEDRREQRGERHDEGGPARGGLGQPHVLEGHPDAEHHADDQPAPELGTGEPAECRHQDESGEPETHGDRGQGRGVPEKSLDRGDAHAPDERDDDQSRTRLGPGHVPSFGMMGRRVGGETR
jgi:hypothetical protein